MSDHKIFKEDCEIEIEQQGADKKLKDLSLEWMIQSAKHKYSYHFEWLGRPIIQHPQDMIGVQQLLWDVQPDLIIETGIARGGSLIYYASILELIAQCGGEANAKILGIDIDIREHNRAQIISHPMSKRIDMIEGSSVADDVVRAVKEYSKHFKKILVCLDSNHTHDHVFEELMIYAPFVTRGSYCIVFDTYVEDLPENLGPTRPWGKSNNPKTAVWDYLELLKTSDLKDYVGEKLNFNIDKQIENQLLLTVAPDGFLRRE